jgi:hypothetical protein
MYVSGVASDPLCRDRYPRFQETKSNLPPTVVRVRSEQIEGCQARQSTDPHKLRGSKPQQGSLTSVLDTHGPRQRAQQSLGLTVCSCGPKASGSGSLAQCYRHATIATSKASTDIRNHKCYPKPIHGTHMVESSYYWVTCMPIGCGEGAARGGRTQPGPSAAW